MIIGNSYSQNPKITVNPEILQENRMIRSFYSGLFAWMFEDDHPVVLIIPSVRIENGKIQYARMPNGKMVPVTQYKFLGGKDDGTYEMPYETLLREIRQEGLRPRSKFQIPQDQMRQYDVQDWPDQVWKSPYIHRRYFWMVPLMMVEEFKGLVHFRKTPSYDWDKGKGENLPREQRCGEMLLTPTFLDVEVLARGLIFHSHVRALAKGILELAENPAALDSMSDELLAWAESGPNSHLV